MRRASLIFSALVLFSGLVSLSLNGRVQYSSLESFALVVVDVNC